MPTLKDLREQALMGPGEFARYAGISYQTYNRMETGISVTRLMALKVVSALNRLLGTQYDLKDIDGISLK